MLLYYANKSEAASTKHVGRKKFQENGALLKTKDFFIKIKLCHCNFVTLPSAFSYFPTINCVDTLRGKLTLNTYKILMFSGTYDAITMILQLTAPLFLIIRRISVRG